MKVVHILKKIEMIDQDIKELKKLEKTIQKNKSFSTPIYMSIEKQINLMLGERIKLLELKIDNPPIQLLPEAAEVKAEEELKPPAKPAAPKRTRSNKAKKAGAVQEQEEEFSMLTQDKIDEKIKLMEEGKDENPAPFFEQETALDDADSLDDHVKLLDLALEKGTLNKESITKEKKKVRFFRDNFPGGEY